MNRPSASDGATPSEADYQCSQPVEPGPQTRILVDTSQPLTAAALAAAAPGLQKEMVGAYLYPKVFAVLPSQAAVITDRLLHQDNNHLLLLIDGFGQRRPRAFQTGGLDQAYLVVDYTR